MGRRYKQDWQSNEGQIALIRIENCPDRHHNVEDPMISVAKTYSATVLVLATFLLTAGCTTVPYSSKGTKVHTVNVGPKIEPLQINAGRGDEVRWVNQRSEPIAVVFPKSDAFLTSCRTGFKTVDQTVLSALVAPNASASLCFSELGKYNYQVRLDENIPSAEVDRNASVWIVGRGERNPKPGEQFENITP
jgi:plastocyanin